MATTHKFCIATIKRPTDFDKYVEMVKSSATEHGLIKVIGYTVVEGYGCTNHGIMIEGEENDAETFVRQLCMVLQPGKYSKVFDSDPGVNEGQFEMKL